MQVHNFTLHQAEIPQFHEGHHKSCKKNNNCKDSNKCKEKGCHHVIGIGKKGRNRQCHIHPYNASSSSGHGEVRRHNEVKELTIQVLRRKNDGVKTISKLNFVKIFQGVLLI